MNVEIITTILSVLFIIFITYVSGKVIVNEKIKSIVPLGVEFADNLKEKTNKEKLIKAISFVEITVLNLVPVVIRPVVDYLIDSEKIATQIERYLTKRKLNS
jgi:hypothetical protein